MSLGLPTHSNEKSAPPRVKSTRYATRSPLSSAGFTKWVAPNLRAVGSRAGFTSIATIIAAPARRAPWITLRPIPPIPNTTTDVADLVEGGVFADLGQGYFGDHRVVGEGRGAHVVVNHSARLRETAG